ncbi:tetratricopeptide repeat-containing protein [Mycena rebaudengoi]|nr:tetratricopeptide repeat-containing protein [Mycena rebaudengoi]
MDHKGMVPEAVESPSPKLTSDETDLKDKIREREGSLYVSSPNSDADSKGNAIEYFQKAHDCLSKCKSAGDISSLNKAITLLQYAASTCSNVDRQYQECFNQFATALLTRFIYTGKAEDVQNAVNLRAGPVLGHPVEVHVQYTDDHKKVNTQDMMKNAASILVDFLQVHDQVLLENAILLYKEALKLLPDSHSEHWKIMWELSEGLLIQFHLTDNVAPLEEAIACLHQVQRNKPNRLICLCAALATGYKGPNGQSNMLMAMDLVNRIVHRNAKALKMAQVGQAAFRSFNMDLDLMKLEAAVRDLGEAEFLLSWGHSKRAPLLNQLGASFGFCFELKGNAANLKMSIEALRESVGLQDPSDPNRGDSLHNLATAVQSYFDLQGDPKDINEAIMLHREALKVHASPHPNRGHSLNYLASALQMRFTQEGDPNDIEEAVQLHREALEIHGRHHRDHSVSLNNLAAALQTRFKQKKDVEDIDEAMALLRIVVEIRAPSHPQRNTALSNLAAALHTRFLHQGDPKDIDEAVKLSREALEICLPHQDSRHHLSNLATVVHTRFTHRGDRQDIDEVIELNRAALKTFPSSHPDRGTSLNNLANAVHSRFSQWGDPQDINEAIQLHQEALNMCASSNPNHPRCLSNLATALNERFKQQRDPGDLDESLKLLRRALEVCPAPHPDRGMVLVNCATAIISRFNQQGDPRDNDEAIQLLREALAIWAISHPQRSAALDTLAGAVLARFHQHGDPTDLDESIQLHREALEIRRAPHPGRGKSLQRLGLAIRTRFNQRGESRDIDEAIQLLREALDICPVSHPNRSSMLRSQGIVLQTWAMLKRAQKEIDEAIELYRQALELRSASHRDRSQSLNCLATAILVRFENLGDPKDIDEAIELFRQAIGSYSAPHPEYSNYLGNLAYSLYARFEQNKDSKNIEEAIQLLRELKELSPAPHPSRGMRLANFGCILHIAYSHQPKEKILEEAISMLQEASTYMFSSPLSRYDASHMWTIIAAAHGHDSCLPAYYTHISLLPQLAAFHLDIKSRRQMLTRETITSLASTSAMCAIGLQQNNVAVEFLEGSRSIFWAQALHLRTPLDHLAKADHQLARKLRTLSQQLELASFRDTSRDLLTESQHEAMGIEAEAAWCRKLNGDWEETIKAVQKLPGFEDFMRLKSIASLRQAAVTGPIIILLAGKSACSALIVRSSDDVQHVPLPALSLQAVKLYSDFPRALFMGNFDIVKFLDARGPSGKSLDQPDLEARLFGYREDHINMSTDDIFRRNLAEMWKTIKSASPPRLWWCPTGPFAFLPIHAAGIYDEHGTDCVSDYAVSSYTPTLAALLDPPTNTTASFKMTAVIEPDAPNCAPLPGTVEDPTGLEVAPILEDSSIVHFACHGIQDSQNPLDSGLMLSDGRLKVSQIMRKQDNASMDVNKKSMSLAFLSACETAKGDDSTPDEAMHLAATLLFAGFRGVVATMWTMNDEDGPKITDTFYENLFKDCDPNSTPPVVPDLTKSAEALHLAVSQLRKQPGMTFNRWVPFVHYGL